MFVHLSCRSHYSFLDSVLSPDDIARRAAELGMPAVAMTDSANLCGMVEFQKACDTHSVQPIFGATLWTMPDDHVVPPKSDTPAPGYCLGLIAENAAGYRNLCRLITVAHTQRDFAPRIRPAQLLEDSEGLIVLTRGRFGPIGMLDGDRAQAEIERLSTGLNRDQLFVELVDWGLEVDGPRNDTARAIARTLSLDTVVTGDCRYLEPKQSPLISVVHSIALGCPVYESAHPDPHDTDQAFLRSEEEIRAIFPDDPDAIERAGSIAERCTHRLDLGKVYLPESEPPSSLKSHKSRWNWLLDNFPPPKNFPIGKRPRKKDLRQGWSLVDEYVAWYARTGLQFRLDREPAALQFGTAEDYSERLEMELSVIQSMGFSAYHLIVAEFINWAKDAKIAVGPGRGSAAGSVVTWAMRITDINALQFGLMFERYLNPMRVSMPDIDVDFEQGRREEVIAHVRQTYGDAQVGQILTIGTMKAKAALKDCARAHRVMFLDADKWSKAMPEGPKVKLKEAIESNPWLRNMYASSGLFRNIAEVALQLEGRPRQTGVHAAGVIITSRPIESFAPMHYEPGGQAEAGKTMTGVEMNAAEDLGLVKFDFLGLKTLDIIETACDSVEARTGIRPQPLQPLFDDPAVFELLTNGDSLGLFQVESHGMQDLLRRMRPDGMEDLIAILALYRPGPLGSGMVDQYIECKHGRAEVVYPHPLLEEVLAPTYGVIVYQEQVMKGAQALAGFDLAQADLLRRAMGKKKQKEMDAQRVAFVKGCQTQGIKEGDAVRIFNLIDHFAGYGFNRSHSASYAAITYMTAYLKAHYRADLMAAAMTFEQANRDLLIAYVSDCLQAGIEVLPPDVNRSKHPFTVEVQSDESLAIRYGLGAIKGLGEAALQVLLEQQPYDSFDALCAPQGINKSVLQALIGAGATDTFGIDRFEAWWELNKPKPTRAPKGYSPNQIDMFSGRTMGETKAEADEEKETEARPRRWSFTERLDRERGALGCWLSGHPLDRFVSAETRLRTCSTGELPKRTKKDTLTLVGVITKVHAIRTQRGKDMGFFTLSDRVGLTEVVLQPKAWAKYAPLVNRDRCVAVRGRLDRDGDQGKVIVDLVGGVRDLARQRSDAAKGIHLCLQSSDTEIEHLNEIRTALEPFILPNAPKGCRLRIHLRTDSLHIVLELDNDPIFDPAPELFEAIEALTGRPNVLAIYPPLWKASQSSSHDSHSSFDGPRSTSADEALRSDAKPRTQGRQLTP